MVDSTPEGHGSAETEPGHGKTRRGEPCGAKTHQGGHPCKLRAGQGTNHVGVGRCRFHGGSTRNHKTNAEVVAIETQARTLFGQVVPVVPVENPIAMFAAFAGRVMAWMQTMDHLIAQLASPRYDGDRAGEQIRGEVQLFERAMDRCNTVLSTYAKLNIDERLSRISEAQQFMVVQAIEAALSAANVTGAAAIEAKKAAARRLRVA